MTAISRILRAGALALLLVALLAAAAVAWLAATPAGTRYALGAAAGLAGKAFAFDAASGTLSESVELRGVRVRHAGTTFEAGRLALRWQPLALLDGTLRLRFLRAADVRLDLPAAADEPRRTTPRLPSLPVAVRLDALVVEGLAVTQDGAGAERIDRVQLGLEIDRRRLVVSRLAVDGPGFGLEGEATFTDARVPRLELALDASVERDGRRGRGEVGLAGPLDRLELEGRAELPLGTAPAEVNVRGTLHALADPPRATLAVTVASLAAGDDGAATVRDVNAALVLTPNAADVDLSATVEASPIGTRQVVVEALAVRDADRPTDGRLTLNWHATANDGSARADGAGQVELRDGALRFEHTLDGPLVLTSEGTVSGLSSSAQVDARTQWSPAEFELPDGERVSLGRGALHVRGTLADLALSGETDLAHPRLGPATLAWQGRLAPGTLHVAPLEVSLLGGTLEADATARWDPAPELAFSFRAADVDLARVLALAGQRGAAVREVADTRVAMAGAGRVETSPDGPRLALTLEQAAGRWRGLPLAARAGIEAHAGRLRVRDGRLTLGANRASADLDVGATLSGGFTLELPRLEQFGAGVAGSLAATGRVGGSRATPAVNAHFEGKGLRYGDLSAALLSGQADFDLSTDAPLEVRLDIQRLRRGEALVDALEVALEGTTAAHRLALSANAGVRTLRATASGGLAEARWDGRLEALATETGVAGAWSLAAPAAIGVAEGALSIDDACLVSGEARACVRADRVSSAGGTADVAVERLPLSRARDFLPRTIGLEGRVFAEARVRRADGAFAAAGEARVEGGVVRLHLEPENSRRLPVHNARATLELEPARLAGTLVADVGELFSLDARFAHALDGTRSVDGALQAASVDIAWLGEFAPLVAGSRGGAELDATVSGTLDAPSVVLDARLADGTLFVQPTGTRVSDLALSARSPAGRRLNVEARASEGTGTLSVTGALALDPAAGWPGRFHVEGEAFPFVRLPDAEADASPALDVTFGDGTVDVTGTVTIPRVAVSLLRLPASAVSVSADEIIVTPSDATAPQAGAAPASGDFFARAVSGDVSLVLGDAVEIDAAGLSARLTGGLRWSKARGDGLGRGEGRVSIADGSYQAYGQDLDIQRGHLIFAGPIDNPALDVRAVRPGIGVVAGLRVTGYMTEPSFSLFSSPSMADSEILSYIVTGHGLSDASSGEAGLIARAALSLGAERSSIVTSQVQDAFGLDELSVSTGDTARETSLVAGKRLTPRLSVRSDFNPFDRLWSFFLNYKLTSTWSVEAESGQRQGADLIYGVERDTILPEGWLD